jgi:uncharacterized protein (TIGR03086 family)
VAQLTRGLELLESALGYALAGAALVGPQLLSRPTPCQGWDVATLLDHLSDSIAVVHDAVAPKGAGAAARRPAPEADPVVRLRDQAVWLLDACAAALPAGHRVTIGDRELSASMAAVVGALEITVHGWDISVACGAHRAVPLSLAAVLLPIAPLLVRAETRPGLFGDPIRLLGPAGPGDQLVAFLGRTPFRGDSERSTWSA